MSDLFKIQKLLNLTSSVNDSEALSALRMAQKFLEKNLGDYLASSDNGLSAASAEKDALYEELETLFEQEVEKSTKFKNQSDDKEKSLRKNQRDIQNLKRDLKASEERVDELEEQLAKVLPQKSSTPLEEQVRNLEGLYDAEVNKNDSLKRMVDLKDKSLKKATKDVSNLKREVKSLEAKINGFEKTINTLSEELMAVKRDTRPK